MGPWIKSPLEEAAPFAALSLRARGLHELLWKRQRDGALDACAHDLEGLAREIARRLGATAGDRRWLAEELGSLEQAGYLVRRGEQWLLVACDERPSATRTERQRDANTTRTAHELNTNTTRTERERDTKTELTARNHSAAETSLSDSPSERRDKKEESAPAHPHEGARTREGQPATAAGGWWLDPWAVANRLRERSGGKLSLTLNGHERELSRTLATIAAQRPRLADELDHWAALVGRGEASWWTGALTIGALLGRPDETGKRTADGLIRCLEETSLRMPQKPAPLRVVPSKPAPQNLITPERAQELIEQSRRERAALRAAEEAAATQEAANG
jgi:hypothetical protein